MWTQNASVRVPEGFEKDGGYVVLRHGQVYTLMLHNGHGLDADATVEIDGKVVGGWRVGARRTITLERPVDDTGRFTFLVKGTPEFASAQLSESDPNLGLVKVTFRFGTHARPLQPMWVYPHRIDWYEYDTQPNTVAPDWTYRPSNTSVTYRTTVTSNSVESVALASMKSGGTGLTGQSNQNFHTVAPLSYEMSLETTIYLRLVTDSDNVRPLRATAIPPRVD